MHAKTSSLLQLPGCGAVFVEDTSFLATAGGADRFPTLEPTVAQFFWFAGVLISKHVELVRVYLGVARRGSLGGFVVALCARL